MRARGAKLIGADLNFADLRCADLSQADLRGASLQRAKIAGTNFSQALLEGADLTDVYLGEPDKSCGESPVFDGVQANTLCATDPQLAAMTGVAIETDPMRCRLLRRKTVLPLTMGGCRSSAAGCAQRKICRRARPRDRRYRGCRLHRASLLFAGRGPSLNARATAAFGQQGQERAAGRECSHIRNFSANV
jgi:hypothetical protein